MECYRICILFVLSSLFVGIYGKGATCSLSRLFLCGEGETCEQIDGHDLGICKCRPGYKRAFSGGCDPLPPQSSVKGPSEKHSQNLSEPDPPQASSEQRDSTGTSVSGWSIVLGTIIPIALIGGAVALVYSARRYKCHERVRRLGIRRYEEVFIGRTEEEDDDAPIA